MAKSCAVPSVRFRSAPHAPDLIAAGFDCTEQSTHTRRNKARRPLCLAAVASLDQLHAICGRGHGLSFPQRKLIARPSTRKALSIRAMVVERGDTIFVSLGDASAEIELSAEVKPHAYGVEATGKLVQAGRRHNVRFSPPAPIRPGAGLAGDMHRRAFTQPSTYAIGFPVGSNCRRI